MVVIAVKLAVIVAVVVAVVVAVEVVVVVSVAVAVAVAVAIVRIGVAVGLEGLVGSVGLGLVLGIGTMARQGPWQCRLSQLHTLAERDCTKSFSLGASGAFGKD